jgi:hypothetical protein
MIGAPAISMNCLGICPPNLTPLPAAGIIAMFIIYGQWVGDDGKVLRNERLKIFHITFSSFSEGNVIWKLQALQNLCLNA